MKISTEILSPSRILGEEKAVEYLAKGGFDAWDFSMFAMCKYDWEKRKILENDHPLTGNDYLKFARRLKQIGLDNGIVCNQSHAPFPTFCPQIRSYLKRAIECTAEAGGEICVIHPDRYKGPQENAEMFCELLPFASDCGVKIATENMYEWDKEQERVVAAACGTPENFCAHIDAVNSDHLVACLDIGHAELLGAETSAVKMIKALGSRLQALHIHDNDKRNDSHQLPFSMRIDFVPIVKALKEIGYNGYFTLEADNFLREYTKENILDGIKEMSRVAKKLGQIYEG